MVIGNDIITVSMNEHSDILNQIDELLKAINGFEDNVDWGEMSYMEVLEILRYVRVQMFSLYNIKETILKGFYRDSFHLLRMVFESYFVLRLISTCEKYPFRIKIQRTKNDATVEQAKARRIQEARTAFGNRLVETYMEDKSTLVAVVRGIPVVDSNGNDTGRVIPYYYHAWHHFRPVEHHLRNANLQNRIPTLRFLTGEWAVFSKRVKKELDEDYGYIYRNFLTFPKILENLRLNGVLNKKLTTRVLVHYNYLSNFTHCTSDSISFVTTRRLSEITPGGLTPIYNHYSSELALLYVVHLLSMYLEHSIHFLKWSSVKLKNKREYLRLCKKTESDFGYFWFIFNKPHIYDRYIHANKKCNYKKQLHFRPEDIRLRDVRYYDDPLYRLKQMHQTQHELTSGNAYQSPFHRNDVF